MLTLAGFPVFIGSNEDIMAEFLFHQAKVRVWLPDARFGLVAVQAEVGHYGSYPHVNDIEGADLFIEGLRGINCAAELMTGTHVVQRITQKLSIPSDPTLADAPRLNIDFFSTTRSEDEVNVSMSQDLQVQVIGNLQSLGCAKRHRQSFLAQNFIELQLV